MKKIIGLLVIVLLLVGAAFFFLAPYLADSRLNPILLRPPYLASEKARNLHRELFIVDLHADSLLWKRDLLSRNSRGHVDIPRLIEANVSLQAFTIVTKTPRGLNIESNDDKTDNVTLLAIAERWPTATWHSLKERALYQASKLSDAAVRSQGKFVLIRTAGDLSEYLKRHSPGDGTTAGFLGVEGAHALEGNLNNIDVFFDHGIRMMSPTHFFDNDITAQRTACLRVA